MSVKKGDIIAVWFSCGAASAVAAKKTLEKYGDIADVRIVNNPVKEEHPDNRRFLKDVEAWLNHPIEIAINKKYPNYSCVEVWDERKYMEGLGGAPCTFELKKKAREQWEEKNHPDWHVLGFTLNEWDRAERFMKGERSNMIPVLIDEKLSKFDCFQIVIEAGVKLPEIYSLGYPNANCIGCVKATSPTYWNHVRKMHPDEFKQRAEQSRDIGARLVRVNGERIFLDQLSPNERGGNMHNMQLDCGIFCEERY